MNQPFASPKWESAGWTVTGWERMNDHQQLRAVVHLRNRHGELGRVPVWTEVADERHASEALERAFAARDVSCDEFGAPQP